MTLTVDGQQQEVGTLAGSVEGALDSAGRGTDARLDLGSHATGEGAARHQRREFIRIGKGDEARGVVPIAQHTRRTSQEDEFLGLEGDRERFRHGIGIHVVHVAVPVPGEARHDRDEARIQQGGEHSGIGQLDISHVAKINLGPFTSLTIENFFGRPALSMHDISINARKSDSFHATIP